MDVEVPSHSDSFGNESYDVTGESFNAGTDCMEDVAGLDLLSDEDLMESLFGRVDTLMDTSSDESESLPFSQVEGIDFEKLRLQK